MNNIMPINLTTFRLTNSFNNPNPCSFYYIRNYILLVTLCFSTGTKKIQHQGCKSSQISRDTDKVI